MPKAPLTPEEVETARRRICDVAMRLFAREGYRQVSMRAIATELGWSPMTAYRYYKSKTEIFVAVRELALARLADAMVRAARRERGPVARLRAYHVAYAEFALKHPNEHRLAFDVHESGMGGLRLFTPAALRSWQLTRDAAIEACAAGELGGDPLEIVHLLWAGVHGLVELQLAERLVFERDVAALLEPMLDAVLARYAPVVAAVPTKALWPELV